MRTKFSDDDDKVAVLVKLPSFKNTAGDTHVSGTMSHLSPHAKSLVTLSDLYVKQELA